MWALLAVVGLAVLVAQLPAGSGELRELCDHASPRGGAPGPRLAFRLPPTLTLRRPGGAVWAGRRSPGQSSVAHATLLRGVVGAPPNPALAGFSSAELRARARARRAALTRCAAAPHAGNVTAAAPDVPAIGAKKAAKKDAAKKSTAANKAAGKLSAAAPAAAAAQAKTPKRAAAKKAAGARKSAAAKVPERPEDQAPAPALEAGEQRPGPESAEVGVGSREGAEHAAQVKAPGAKPKRRARKKVAWTDDALLVEFALKAVMLLREAGGELESSKFLLRWKCTFPSDQVSRYMSGRRLSVRQLLLQCGNTFTVADIAGSRTKKLFRINDEHDQQDKALGVWPNEALEDDQTPLTRGERLAAIRGLGGGATDLVRVVKGSDRERPDANSMLDGPWSEVDVAERLVETSAPGAELESSSAPPTASELETDAGAVILLTLPHSQMCLLTSCTFAAHATTCGYM